MKVLICFFVTATFVLSIGSAIASTGETSQKDEANTFHALKSIEVEITDSTSIVSLTDEELSEVQGGHYCPIRSRFLGLIMDDYLPDSKPQLFVVKGLH